ncbi:hypothetical protein ACOMHN_006855 [Nucella lapillus]
MSITPTLFPPQAVETRKRAYTKLAVCWVSSFLLYTPAILFWDVVRGRSIVAPDDCDVEFADNVIFVVVTEVVSFSVPFVSLTVLNVLIFRALKKRRRTRQSLDSKPRETVTKIPDRESDCQTVTKIPDRESDYQTVTKIRDTDSKDRQTVTKIPDTDSKDCQTVTKIRDTDSKDRQTVMKIRDTDYKDCEKITKIPDTDSKDRQTVTKIRDTDSKDRQTVTKIRDTDSKDRQTVMKIRDTDSKDCEKITKIPDTDSKDRQTITKIRDTDSKDCQTVTKIRDTDSKDRQTTLKWYGACAVVSFNKPKLEIIPESSNSKCRLLNKINPRQGSSDSSISHGVKTFSSRMLKPGTRNSCDNSGICVSGSKPELHTFSLFRASDLPNQSQKPPPFQTPFPCRQFHHSSVSQTSVSTIQSQMSPHLPDPASTNPQQTPTPSEPSHQPSLFQTNVNHSQIHPHAETNVNHSQIPPHAETNVNHSQIHPHAETSFGRRGREKESEEKQERRVAMILVGLVVALVVFWLPYSLTTILLVACSDCVNADAYDVFNWMLWMKSCVNPFLYAYNSPRFRHNFQQLLCHLLPARLLRKSKMTLNGTSRANTQQRKHEKKTTPQHALEA